MISDNKRIAKNTAFLYIRMIITMLVKLWVSRVVLNVLGVTDYGIYNVVGGIVMILNFLQGSLSATTLRYLSVVLGKGTIKEVRDVFNGGVQLHALLAVLIILLGESIGFWIVYTQLSFPPDRFEAAIWVYQISLISCVISLMNIPYTSFIIAKEHMSVFAYISLFEAFLNILMAYLITVISADKLILYALLMFTIQLAIRIVNIIYCKFNFQESVIELKISKNVIKNMSGFALWSVFGNLASLSLTEGFNMLLNVFFGPIVNASRAIAVQVQHAVGQFVSNFQTAVNPQIYKIVAQKEIENYTKLMKRSSRYSFLLLFIISAPIISETETALKFWLGQVPQYSVDFVRIVLFVSLIDSMGNSLITAIQATGVIKSYQILVGCLMILVVPVTFFLLKIGMPPHTVFLTNMSVSIFDAMLRLCILKRLIGFKILNFVLDVYLRNVIVVISFFMILSLNSLPLNYPAYKIIVVFFIGLFSCGVFGVKWEEYKYVCNMIINKNRN